MVTECSESILVFDAAEHFGVGRSVRLKFRRIIEFMNDDLSVTAKLLADPGRAAMLLSLMGGIALPAGELATIGNIAPQTASGHLAKLVEGRLLTVEQQGRHRYYRLSSREVGDAIEGLLVLTGQQRPREVAEGIRRTTPGSLAGLSQMRWCFSHAAGFLSACGASSRLDERIPGIQRSS